jgi:hypothetical protein
VLFRQALRSIKQRANGQMASELANLLSDKADLLKGSGMWSVKGEVTSHISRQLVLTQTRGHRWSRPASCSGRAANAAIVAVLQEEAGSSCGVDEFREILVEIRRKLGKLFL